MRPAASLSVESYQMTWTEKFACDGCDRTFLSTTARRRHYDWNPEHAGAGAATDRAGATRTDAEAARTDVEASVRAVGRPGDRWVEFEDRFETFLALGDDERQIDVEYRPDEGAVLVDRPSERRIDVSAAQALASERVRWTFGGGYLTLTVPKR